MAGVGFRRSAGWTQQLDERILEHLAEEDWSSPTVMASRPEFRWASEARLRERCEMLIYAGFVYPLAREMLEITTWGSLYLNGELDARHQPHPTRNKLHS